MFFVCVFFSVHTCTHNFLEQGSKDMLSFEAFNSSVIVKFVETCSVFVAPDWSGASFVFRLFAASLAAEKSDCLNLAAWQPVFAGLTVTSLLGDVTSPSPDWAERGRCLRGPLAWVRGLASRPCRAPPQTRVRPCIFFRAPPRASDVIVVASQWPDRGWSRGPHEGWKRGGGRRSPSESGEKKI